jgi:hypothetical protein
VLRAIKLCQAGASTIFALITFEEGLEWSKFRSLDGISCKKLDRRSQPSPIVLKIRQLSETVLESGGPTLIIDQKGKCPLSRLGN